MKFQPEQLAIAIQRACPEVTFALLHGSAKEGDVKPGSDLDVALYVEQKASLDMYQQAFEAVRTVLPDVEPDIGILNHAEPIYRFEALKGTLLFCRDQEKYLSFFSQTSRAYEYQLADYQRQHQYRLEAAAS